MTAKESDKLDTATNQSLYYPPRDLVENSNVMQWMKKKGLKTEKEMRAWTSQHYVEFWDEMARTYADWFEPYRSVVQWKSPNASWFVGGKINVAHNAVDRHAHSWRRNKLAYIFVGEPVDDVRKITYYELYREVCRFANALKSMGVKKGDRVCFFLPMIPELAIGILACSRIGAIHSVVFGGFSAEALRDRIQDSTSKVLVTCDGTFRGAKAVPQKTNADAAVKECPSVEKYIVVKRVWR